MRTADVIELKPRVSINPKNPNPMWDIVHDLAVRINKSSRDGITYKSIAESCKVSPTTVANIANGETKEPRFSTVYKLYGFFGERLYVGPVE